MNHTMKKISAILMLLAVLLTATGVMADPVEADMGDRYEAPEVEGNSPVVENLIVLGTIAGIGFVAAKNPRREHMGSE